MGGKPHLQFPPTCESDDPFHRKYFPLPGTWGWYHVNTSKLIRAGKVEMCSLFLLIHSEQGMKIPFYLFWPTLPK